MSKAAPVILQAEATECGLACLVMVANYHRHHIDLMAARRKFALSRRGMTLADLIRAANELGLETRPLKLEVEQTKELTLPAICHWELDHFVVLQKVTRSGAKLADPSVGQRTVTWAEFHRGFSGIALELTPGANFKPKQADKPGISLVTLFRSTPGLAAALIKLGCLSLVLQAFALTVPFYSQLIIDHVLATNDRDLLMLLAIAFAVAAVLQTAFAALRSWMVVFVSARLKFQWYAGLFRHLIHLPLSYFENRSVGDIQSRVHSLKAVEPVVTQQFVEGVMDGLMTAITLILMFVYAPALAGVSVAALAVYVITRRLTFQPLFTKHRSHVRAQANLESHFLETLRTMVTIKNFNRETHRHQLQLNKTTDALNAEVAGQRIGVGVAAVNEFTFSMEHVIGLFLGALAIIDAELTVGMLVAFLAYKNQFINRATTLVDRIAEILLVRVHLGRLADVIQATPEILTTSDEPPTDPGGTPTDPGGTPTDPGRTPTVSGKIDVHDLWFRYADNQPWILQALNLTVASGEYVAIVAPSGFGKSTLLKCLMGLLPPTSGEVRVDGRPISNLGVACYRRCYAAVMQEDALLSGSLFDNICCFDGAPDPERVMQAAALAAIADDIAQMPMGYQTLVGDLGDALSGGQRQRVLLARALYKQPAILFLDEATCHLDGATQSVISRTLAALPMTRIVITHDPETLEKVDRIIDLTKPGPELTATSPTRTLPAHR